MNPAETVLCVIPARGGSKGLPGKNVRPLCGKPLVNWTVERSLRSSRVTTTCVSTDAPHIAEIARAAGADVPFLRPAELASDSASSIDVVLHALDFYAADRGRNFDAVALLEPTSPLRKHDDLDRAIEAFFSSELYPTSLVSGGEVHMEHPMITKVVNGKGFVEPLIRTEKNIYQRQQLPTVWFPYGVIYLSDTRALRETRSFYQERTILFPIERWQNYEIDDLIDFLCVETIMRNHDQEFA